MVAQRNAIQLRTNRLLSNWIYACGVIVPKKHELWAAQERRSSRRQAGVIELIRIFNWLLLYLKTKHANKCTALHYTCPSHYIFRGIHPPATAYYTLHNVTNNRQTFERQSIRERKWNWLPERITGYIEPLASSTVGGGGAGCGGSGSGSGTFLHFNAAQPKYLSFV